MTSAIELVREERGRQHVRWGNHRPEWEIWLAILMEEVGESSEAALKLRFEGGSIDRLQEEMVQVAAVAIAALEHILEMTDTERRDP